MSSKTREAHLSRELLKEYFIDGFKKPQDLKVGVEWEKLGVYKDSGEAIRYAGENGVEAIFRALVKKFGWEPVFSGPHVTALKKNDSSITLEPGGQIELSGRKATSLDENASELYAHLNEIKEISAPLGIGWLGLGVQPVSSAEEMEWVPKERYAIMQESLKDKGALTYQMMKQTASIQVSLDFTDEADAVQKLRLAMSLAPIFSAMFANSPISGGKPNGFLSRRSHIWSQTAPERTGIIWDVFNPDYTLDNYVEFALKVPMLFIVRQDRWISMKGIPFHEFLKNGAGDDRPTLADWDLQLTTIFTEARLKKYLEIRSIDCQKTELGLAVPALLKGLFYDDAAAADAWKLTADLSLEERRRLSSEAPVKGLKTGWKGKTLLEPATQLLQLADEGLNRLTERKLASHNESKYLAPLKDLLLNKKMTPAEVLMECLNEKGTGKMPAKKIIECASI